MTNDEASKADDEAEAAKLRLKGFVKKASESKNYHDPEQLARHRDGNPNAPRLVSWAELAQRWRTL